MLYDCLRQQPGHGPDPALDMAGFDETALFTIAQTRMEEGLGASGTPWATPHAGDALDGEGHLEAAGLEPIVQQVRDAHRKDAGQIGDAPRAQPSDAPSETQLIQEIRWPS